MGKKVTIGLGQLLVEGGEPDRNMARAIRMIEEAAEKKCDIILLPETMDFAWTHPSGIEEAEPIPGKYSNMFCEQAAKYGIFICVGLTEKKGNKNYNSAILIDRNGHILLKYHKINLLSVEFPFYEIGNTLNVVETEFGKIGLNICADNYIDSLPIGHTLARMGAQVILSPSSWTVDYSITEEHDPYEEKWLKPYKILSGYYGIVIVGTTSVGYIVGGPYEGKKSIGCSLMVGPDGIIGQGKFNEFAGELIIHEFEVPERTAKGTEIGKSLLSKGATFDQLL
ncbi:MAG: carbon-nitrogen hydrolase family protein [Crocinitomicaceae bacterium]|nr:carbon-nitrogen hydrolase family protein [Crocinitomicaceae bacterium]